MLHASTNYHTCTSTSTCNSHDKVITGNNDKIRVGLSRKMYKIILLSLVFIACLLMIKPSYMVAKSVLAQILLNAAWQEAKQQGDYQKILPWQWADSYPVAKLTYLKINSEKGNKEIGNKETVDSWIILAGMTGRARAFAPTWLEDSAKPNKYGNTVISAHNDSHFNGLEYIDIGDEFLLEDQKGNTINYRVMTIDIVSEHDVSPYQFQDETMITLITCYPFKATSAAKTQRLVIQAIKDEYITRLN